MSQGLDELIEWLVGQVAYYGEGCAVSDVFASFRQYGKNDEAADDTKPDTRPSDAVANEAAAKAPLTNADLRLGRLIWPHIIDTGDVSAGHNGKWNHLTFDELVSIPEEKPEGSGAAITDIKVRLHNKHPEQTEQTVTGHPLETSSLPKIRPRLFVSEETVWKTLTGHGIDFKRIPLMEWKLLLCIGSTKELGIAQPDLVKTTGQDKRSVPRRTDFLHNKGYIMKRTHMIRGMKTSKLWLIKFAPELPAPANALTGLDVSKAVLTKDMDPVPWVHQWIGNKTAKGQEELSYHALVQTVIAVVKAWGTVRVRDLKAKLGIIGLQWQMKIVSKFLRRANERGNLAYTAAQFAGNSCVFKDCVKFVREPTEDDWRVLLATGVRSRPDWKLSNQKNRKKRKKGNRGRSRKTQPRAVKPKPRALNKRFRLPPSPAVVKWEPEKPIANTLAEYVLTGGNEGYTTSEVSAALVGTEFSRHLYKHMSNMCKTDIQPPGLSEYQMICEPTRSGNVQAYAFRCAGVPPVHLDQTAPMDLAVDPSLAQQSRGAGIDIQDFGFGSVDPSDFPNDDNDEMFLADLVDLAPSRRSKPRKQATKTRLPAQAAAAESAADDGTSSGPVVPSKGKSRGKEGSEETQNADGPTPEAPTRRVRKRKAALKVSYVDNLDALIEGTASGSDVEPSGATDKPGASDQLEEAHHSSAESVKSLSPVVSEESKKPQDRTLPGVYVGIPGSLNPDPKKKGRPRKSLVLIFRSDKLMNANFLPGWADYPQQPQDDSPAPPPKPAIRQKTPTLPSSSADNTPAQVQPEEQIPVTKHGQLASSTQMAGQPAVPGDEGSTLAQGSKAKHASQARTTAPPPVTFDDAAPATASSSTPAEIAAEAEGAIAAPKAQRKKKIVASAILPNDRGMYVCPGCGGQWINDNGIQYHLTKGKNTCNPYYTDNPEAMHRSRPSRKGRYSGSESASANAGSRASSAAYSSGDESLASEASLSPEPQPDLRPKDKEKKRRPPAKKMARNAPIVPEPTDSTDPVKARPVLKPRSLPKDGRLVGSRIVPRGVEASEAAAKRIAAAYTVEEPQHAAPTSAAGEVLFDGQNGAAPAEEYWEPDEELPYLKHVHAAIARPSQRNSPEQASQRSSEHNRDDQAFEAQCAGAAFSARNSPPHFAGSPYAPGVSDPYPAELLDPALRGDPGPVSPASTPAKKRKLLPGSRPGPSADSRVKATVQAPRPGGSVQRLPATVRMPASKYANTQGVNLSASVEKKLLLLRIKEIILYLLDSNGGVYPRDRMTLHWSVLKVFKATFASSLLPTLVGTTRALGVMERNKRAQTASVAIQPGGYWKQYDIVYLPEVRIKEDPAALHLKARAEALHPEMYFPTPFGPTEEERIYFSSLEQPAKKRTNGPGRRDHKLAGDIATLNAPFYKEMGLAGVRPTPGRRAIEAESDDDGRPKKKRRRTRRDDDSLSIKRKRKIEDDGERVVKRRRGRKRPGEEFVILEPSKLSSSGGRSTNPGLATLPASFFSRTAPHKEICFIMPNAQLEDDVVPSTPSEASVDEEDEDDGPASEEEVIPPGICADTFVLRDNGRGVWPNLPPSWFMKHNGNFTLQGWLPTQSERLIANLPRTSADMALKITSHCKTEQWADPAYGVFVTSVDGCKSWELSDLGTHFMSGTMAPEYVFINFSSTKEVSNMGPVGLQWLDENEWTLETIPYDQLEDNDQDPYLQYDISSMMKAKRGRGRPLVPKPRPAPRKYTKKPAKDPSIRVLKLQRELTSYPTSKQEYFRLKGEESLGVDWKAEDTRIAAYVAVSTLTGGIGKAMDWGLMMRLFPESKLSNLRKFWAMMRKEREGFINNLSEKFQEEFLGAYEKGDLGSFDFDDPLNYDWLRLVKWTLALVIREGVELPPNRKRLEDELELLLVDKNDLDWRETYHHWQRSVFNKFQDATSEPASTIIDAQQIAATDNDKTVARSWVRALCWTSPHDYNPIKIRDKFKTLVLEGRRTNEQVSELLEATVFDLEHRRIAIRAKSSALQYGRPYKLNVHFARQLDRYANELKFLVAAEFKLKMDEAFQKGEPVEMPWRTEDGQIVAAFNLQAAGRVRIEPTPATKLNIPFGFKPGFYESRKFPKSHYRFGLQVVPTERYMYNDEIEILHRATQPDKIPGATADGKLPMWCDFFGRPDRGRWLKMCAGVLFAYATRGAMPDDFMQQALKPCYEQFEIETVRKWGLENGVLHGVTGPGSAVTVTEWWWLVLGQPLLEMAPKPEDGRRTRSQYEGLDAGQARRHGKYRVL